MPHSRTRPSSVSSGSLMQDVPGSFPIRTSVEQERPEQTACLSLTEAVHVRRAEYIRPKHVRIKIGTWNVAAYKGTEKDVGAWFVEGKGVAKTLTGLTIRRDDSAEQQQGVSTVPGLEDVAAQEARFASKQPTVPKGDPGTLPGDSDIGLYVLALQEVVDISSTTEALKPYTDPSVAKKWKDELEKALPKGYRVVAEQQLIGLLLLIYASPDIADEVRSVSTTSVGTGLMGYMGNKGAVTGRIVIGDTTRLVFINCHLAAGADKTALERRNWDASQIVQRTRFEPIKDTMDLSQTTGEQIGDEDFAFWVGDLNYRLETIPGEDIRRLLMLHTRNEYDLSKRWTDHKIDKEIEIATEAARHKRQYGASLSPDSGSIISSRPSSDTMRTETDRTAPPTILDDIHPEEDPSSLQTTLSSLLSHDELHQQMKARNAFHDGWREGPISFLPTYKYDIGSVGIFDSSEKRRAPSWCDRILYRTRKDKLAYDAKVKEEELVKRRDAEMAANGTDSAADDDEILYNYDPDADGINELEDYDEYDEYEDAHDGIHKVTTSEGAEDELRIEHYTAHQRVLSSDHKPLDAVFSLKYEAVVPELKAKVHAEVAKDLDKAENEGRPNVTVVVDQQSEKAEEQSDTNCKGFEGVSFGNVKWNELKTRSLTIANTSRVSASFTFIERPAGPEHASGIAPIWLKLKLNDAFLENSSTSTTPVTLEPGETASVELQLRILDANFVRDLHDGVSRLEDILVLRVEGGRDHFIPIKARWEETTLARTIDKLIRIPEGGIRKLQNQRPDKSKSNEQSRSGSGRATPIAEEPVRFSAPRELYRLTESIEKEGCRVIAEWDMIASDSKTAPWWQHPGWPFDKDCWTETSNSWWSDAVSAVCNALDEDQSLEECLPSDMPRMQRLYVLSNFLLIFLENIPDGIITEELWSQIDELLARFEKSKTKPPKEDQRTAIQEILAQSPAHNISFILVTTMLERLLQEIAGSNQAPLSPTTRKLGALRRVTGSFGKANAGSHRDQVCAAMSHIFAGVILGAHVAEMKKHSAAHERRKMELLEVFLRKEEVD